MPRGSFAAIEMPSVEFAHDVLTETVNRALAGEGDESNVSGLPWFEAHRGTGRNIQSHAAGLGAVEGQRRIGLEEMVVGADLDRSVPGIGHGECDGRAVRVEDNVALLSKDFAWNHLTCRCLDAPMGFVCSSQTPTPPLCRRRLTPRWRSRCRPRRSADRVMDRHQLGTIGKRRLNLDLVD